MKVGEIWREKWRKQNQAEILSIKNENVRVRCLITDAEADFLHAQFIALFEKEWNYEKG